MHALILGVAAVMTGCRRAPAERADTARATGDSLLAAAVAPAPSVRPCVDGVVRVSIDSVGPFSSRSTFAELRARCPGARDTIIHGYEYVGPGLWIPTGRELSIFAGQGLPMLEDDRLGPHAAPAESDRPADYWVLSGAAVELPGGLRGSARWGQLVRRYGPAMIVTELSKLEARFCQLPGFTFDIDAYDHAGSRDSFAMLDSLSPGIRTDAGIFEITLAPDAPLGSRPDPDQCRRPTLR